MNFGIPAPLLFGLILVVASAGLFLTSKFKPELHQESDNIYAIIGFVCGLLLLTQLDLGIGMAFQQMLMIGSVVTLMWQYMQVRAENKRLKGGAGGGGRSNSGREPAARRSGYAAKIDEEPEYAPPARNSSRRLNSDRQEQWNNYDDDFDQPVRDNGRMLPEFRRANQVDDLPRRQDEYSDYEAPVPREYGRRSDSSSSERPPADRSRRSRRSNNNDEAAAPTKNRRRSSIDDSADEPAAKSSAYVDYEPVEPSPPANGEQPIQFPDQY